MARGEGFNDRAARGPYQGLVPYTEEDAAFFFGRDKDIRIITANLIGSRFTVLYGPSGVGKSSVLQAGVQYRLSHRQDGAAKRGQPKPAILVFNSWRDDPVANLTDRLTSALGPPPVGEPHVDGPKGLEGILWGYGEARGRDLLLILDQFEEFFLYHDDDEAGASFVSDLALAVGSADLRANFLISIREDALAKLDRFKGRIRGLFDNYLRIDHLDVDSAREAIQRPLEEYNKEFRASEKAITLEPALVDRVLHELATLPGGTGLTDVSRDRSDISAPIGEQARVEAPLLQLVMTRLWSEEDRADSTVLRLATLERSGGSRRILRTHIDESMRRLARSQRGTAAKVFHYLVTPSGTKIAHSVGDLAQYADVDQGRLGPVLERLAGSDLRILRPTESPSGEPGLRRFEVAHDVLAPAILDWRARYLERRARDRWVAGAALVLVAVVVGLVFLLKRPAPPSGPVLAQTLVANPGGGVTASFGTTGEVLIYRQTALLIFDGRSKTKAGDAPERVTSAALSPDGNNVLFATENAVGSWTWRSGNVGFIPAITLPRCIVTGPFITSDGRHAVVQGGASCDGHLEVWDVHDGPRVAREIAIGPALSVQGKRLLGSSDRVVQVMTTTMGRALLLAVSQLDAAVFDTDSGQALGAFQPPSGIRSAVLEPQGRYVAIVDGRGSVGIWATTGHKLKSLSGAHQSATSSAFSPDGQLIVTTNGAQAIVWETSTGRLVSTITVPGGTIDQAAFDPTGKLVITAGTDGTARIWNASSGTQRAVLRHPAPVKSVAFSPDGRHVLTTSADGVARLWDTNLTP